MDDSILINCYKIDDIIYEVLNEVDYNNSHYVFLCNENDDDDIMIRKLDGENLEPLDSEEELKEVLSLITKPV